MKLFISLLMWSLISGCYCNLKLTEFKLHSAHKFDNGFHISKITVDSLSSDQIPLRFTRDTTIRCFPYCYEYASEEEYKLINGSDAVYTDTCRFKPTKNIYFNKVNPDYKWRFISPSQSNIQYDILPIEFRKGNWYEIRNACEYHFIYFYIKEDGNWLVKEAEKW